jgi:tripartite-type tricarboxylate transporter receptor subunit TctC
MPELPDVPSTVDAGFADFAVEIWFGVLAPAKTPAAVVADLATSFQAALKAPAVKPKLADLGLYPVGICLDDFATYIRKQYENYGRIIREANIKGG